MCLMAASRLGLRLLEQDLDGHLDPGRAEGLERTLHCGYSIGWCRRGRRRERTGQRTMLSARTQMAICADRGSRTDHLGLGPHERVARSVVLYPFGSPERAALRPIQMVSAMVGMGALMLSGRAGDRRARRDAVRPGHRHRARGARRVGACSSAGSATSVPALPHGPAAGERRGDEPALLHLDDDLRTALAEAPVLVAFAVSFAFTPHSWLTLLIALPGGLALFWVHAWPSPRTAAALRGEPRGRRRREPQRVPGFR